MSNSSALTTPKKPWTGPAFDSAGDRLLFALHYSLITAGLFLYFRFLSLRVSIDLDETYYIIGADLLFHGHAPYRDYFFPQMPLTAIVFGLWQRCFGHGFASVRLLGAVLATLTGLITYDSVRRRSGTLGAALALLCFCASTHVVLWFLRAKTLGTSALLVIAGFSVLTSRRFSPLRGFVVGLLAGLSVSNRLMAAPLAVLMCVAACLRDPSRKRLGSYLPRIAAGAVAGALPSIVLFALSPDAFLFDNLRYHALRSAGHGLVGNWENKFFLLKLLWGGHEQIFGPQFLLLYPMCLLGAFGCTGKRRLDWVYPLGATIVFLVAFLPTPTWDQYVTPVMPLAIISLSLVPVQKHLLHALQLVVLVPMLFSFWWWLEPNILQQKPPFGLYEPDLVGRAISQLVPPNGRVASKQFTYLAASGRDTAPCSFNVFAYLTEVKLLPATIEQYHLCNDQVFEREVLQGGVQAYIANKDESGLTPLLERSGWTKRIVEPVAVWLAPQSP